MAFRLSPESRIYYTRLNESSTSGRIDEMLEWYWLCAQLGMLHNQYSDEKIDEAEFARSWTGKMKPYRNQIMAMLFNWFVNFQPEGVKEDKRKVTELITEIFQTDESENPVAISERGLQYLDRLAEGGFKLIEKRMKQSSTELHHFLVEYRKLQEEPFTDSANSTSEKGTEKSPAKDQTDESDSTNALEWPPKSGEWKTATWLIEGELAGAERPGRKGPGDTTQVEKSKVDEWIEAAKKMDPPIKSIICLLDDQLTLYKCVEEQGGLIEYYRDHGFEVESESVKHPDHKGYPKSKVAAASEAFGRMEKPVLVHCSAAITRTSKVINDGILPDHFSN
jgi:hypothetical protein